MRYDAETSKIWMRSLYKLRFQWVLIRPHRICPCTCADNLHGFGFRNFIGNQPALWWKLPFQFLLPLDRSDRIVHTKHLMVACDDLSGAAGTAVIEQDEVLNNVEELLLGQHAVE